MRRGSGPRPELPAPARRLRQEVRQDRPRARRSGSIRSGRRRSPSTSSGWTGTTPRPASSCGCSPLRDRAEIEALEVSAAAAPEARIGQRALAADLTERVHGAEVLRRVIEVSEAVFSRTLPITRARGARASHSSSCRTPSSGPTRVAGGPIGLAVAAGLFGSNGEARRSIGQGGLSINEIRVASVDAPVPAPLPGGYLVLRSGKKAYLIVRVTPAS